MWNVRQQRLIGVIHLNTDSIDEVTVVFSPDGHLLASTEAATVRLWNVRTRKQVGPALLSCPDWNTLAFRPDGRIIAANCDGEIRFWNVHTQKQVGAPLETSRVWDLAFSPNGRLLATASKDNNVRLWNVANIGRSQKPTS